MKVTDKEKKKRERREKSSIIGTIIKQAKKGLNMHKHAELCEQYADMYKIGIYSLCMK